MVNEIQVTRNSPNLSLSGSATSCLCCGANIFEGELPEDALVVVQIPSAAANHVFAFCPECAYALEIGLTNVRRPGR